MALVTKSLAERWSSYTHEDEQRDVEAWQKNPNRGKDHETWQATAQEWWGQFTATQEAVREWLGRDPTSLVGQYAWSSNLPTQQEVFDVCKYLGVDLMRQFLVNQMKLGDDPLACFFSLPKIETPIPLAPTTPVYGEGPNSPWMELPEQQALKAYRIPQFRQMVHPIVRFNSPKGPAVALLRQYVNGELALKVVDLNILYGPEVRNQGKCSFSTFWVHCISVNDSPMKWEANSPFPCVCHVPTEWNKMIETIAGLQRMNTPSPICSISEIPYRDKLPTL